MSLKFYFLNSGVYIINTSKEYIGEKIKKILSLIEDNNIENVTIDLRNNLGVDSTLFTPLIDYLKKNNKINSNKNLKIIIGRKTFSSGLLNAYSLKKETNAKIIGEPSGGKPNCYGEILRIVLPNSKFIITYSTRFYKLMDDDSVMIFYPDEIVLELIEDYIKQ